MLESIFNKVEGFMPATLLKRDANTRFSVNTEKILRTAFFIEHLRWLLLQVEKTNFARLF